MNYQWLNTSAATIPKCEQHDRRGKLIINTLNSSLLCTDTRVSVSLWKGLKRVVYSRKTGDPGLNEQELFWQIDLKVFTSVRSPQVWWERQNVGRSLCCSWSQTGDVAASSWQPEGFFRNAAAGGGLSPGSSSTVGAGRAVATACKVRREDVRVGVRECESERYRGVSRIYGPALNCCASAAAPSGFHGWKPMRGVIHHLTPRCENAKPTGVLSQFGDSLSPNHVLRPCHLCRPFFVVNTRLWSSKHGVGVLFFFCKT